MLNRFFGQKPQEDPKRDTDTTNESPVQKEGSERRFGFLSRTRQVFSRMGSTVQENDTITDNLWDDLEESLLGADVGPSTTLWLIDRLRQRVTEEQMRAGSQVQRALREELAVLLGKSSSLRFSQNPPLRFSLLLVSMVLVKRRVLLKWLIA